jgi:hypothetical protein
MAAGDSGVSFKGERWKIFDWYWGTGKAYRRKTGDIAEICGTRVIFGKD